ncbi:pancreatic triacylglycerol lipase-like isoform X2 [Artemia franciscana]|uniref:pancreatic triacylglycerol lipase-like isoform X2 n=1 Tax=Artemia franciscana TaxID=6661 RepID=UPI0032DB6DAA
MIITKTYRRYFSRDLKTREEGETMVPRARRVTIFAAILQALVGISRQMSIGSPQIQALNTTVIANQAVASANVAINKHILAIKNISKAYLPPSSIPNVLKNFASRGDQVCYDDLGCIGITDEWYDPVHRPFNLLPLPREKINTRFILRTRESIDRPQYIYATDPVTIGNSYFEASRPTKFIIHGFVDDGNVGWMREMAIALLGHGDYNAIIVDWGGGSLPLYTQATANTRLVGLEIAFMIRTMIEQFGARAEDFHLIGHSLGSHTAGYAGEQIPGLGRITGLDPAEPYFQYMPAFVRLDETDAQFVDAIHTDAKSILLLGYGMVQPVGHVDFYPNSGRQQPGCSLVDIPLTLIEEGLYDAGRDFVACNHDRSIEFFNNSILTGCSFVGYECPDYDSYLKGLCSSCGPDDLNCAKLGMDAVDYPIKNRKNVQFYFTTDRDKPFCKRHYHISMKLTKTDDAEEWVYGKLKISIFGTYNQIRDINLTPGGSEKFYHTDTRTFLLTSTIDVGKIQRVEVYWNYDADFFKPGTICTLFCNKELFIESVTVSELDYYPESERLENTFQSCPVDRPYLNIGDKSTGAFYVTGCPAR